MLVEFIIKYVSLMLSVLKGHYLLSPHFKSYRVPLKCEIMLGTRNLASYMGLVKSWILGKPTAATSPNQCNP